MGGVGRDDGCDSGVADVEDDLGEKAFNAQAYDFSGELIAPTDPPKAVSRLRRGLRLVLREKWLKGGGGDTVVSARCGGCLQLTREDPLLDRRIADTQKAGGFAWSEQRVCIRHTRL